MENERALRSLLAVVEAKVNDAEATLADLHNRQRVLEQMLAEEIGHAPASAPDTPHITIKEGGLRSNNIQSGDMTVHISKPLHPPWKFLGKMLARQCVGQGRPAAHLDPSRHGPLEGALPHPWRR